MSKFIPYDIVKVVEPSCAAIFGKTGSIVNVKEQEPYSFYTIKIRRKDYGVFENEIRLVEES